MKLLLVLPVFAIVFYAFSEPEYHNVYTSDNTVTLTEPEDIILRENFEIPSDNIKKNFPVAEIQNKEVSGFVVRQDGKPLQGAAIIVKGTSMGTTSDIKGHFRLTDLPKDASLVVSFVGFKTKIVDYGFSSEMKITMVNDTVNYGDLKIVDKDGKEAHPLIVLDGFETEKDIKDIDSWTIHSITVLKGNAASDKYGEKGKNGVIEITTLQKEMQDKAGSTESKSEKSSGISKTEKDLFMVVEELPEFPGGRINLRLWLSQNIKYPVEAKTQGVSGKVFMNFTVTSEGKVTDIKVYKPVHPLLDAEAIRVISSMPDWKPGTQSGNPVDVSISLPVEFN
jgi:TonB family protein